MPPPNERRAIMDLDLKVIAMNVRIARAKKNYSLRELSALAGVGITTLSFIENARKTVRLSTLEKIANVLDTTLENILQDNH